MGWSLLRTIQRLRRRKSLRLLVSLLLLLVPIMPGVLIAFPPLAWGINSPSMLAGRLMQATSTTSGVGVSPTVVVGYVPTLTLTPPLGVVGEVISASGTIGSSDLYSTCTLSSSPSGLLSSPTCSISAGKISGGFTVASGAPVGYYNVMVTTNVAGETASAGFTVTITTSTSSSTTSAPPR